MKSQQHKQLSIFEDDLKVAYVSAKKGIGTFERLNDYDSFVKKFDAKKTTDDCYTPPAVYDALISWMKGEGLISDETEIVRPFYPGLDYQQMVYPQDCVVVDNPPFSIYSQIVRWFVANDIKFLLFGPQLTLKVRKADVCYLPVSASITYENGAVVNTGFVTNLIPDVRLWTAPELHRAIKKASPPKQVLPRNTYPLNLITCATVGKISVREVDFKILTQDCQEITQVQSLANVKKSLFGGGGSYLLMRQQRERQQRERQALVFS